MDEGASDRFGRFLVAHSLDSGSGPRSFLARDSLLRRHVVVRVLASTPTWRPKPRHELVRALRLLSRLDHDAIMPLYFAETNEDPPWIVERHIVGERLDRILTDHPAGNPELAARISRTVGSALDRAHSQRLAHGDVSPRTILVTSEGRPVLTGFVERLTGHFATDTSPSPGSNPVDVFDKDREDLAATVAVVRHGVVRDA